MHDETRLHHYYKMKITLEPYSGGTYTAQTDAEHINEVVGMFRGLLVQVGYHPQTVDDLFTEEMERWFPDQDTDAGQENKVTEDNLHNLYNQTN